MMARSWFDAPIHDIYCGLRGFTKTLYTRLDQKCTGMEFATEMIIKSSLYHEKIAEVPITLHPDGRKSHPPHLKTFRDGWRTLRFFLMYSPRSLFLLPGYLPDRAWCSRLCARATRRHGRTRACLGRTLLLLFASVAMSLRRPSRYSSPMFTKLFAIREGMMPLRPTAWKPRCRSCRWNGRWSSERRRWFW